MLAKVPLGLEQYLGAQVSKRLQQGSVANIEVVQQILESCCTSILLLSLTPTWSHHFSNFLMSCAVAQLSGIASMMDLICKMILLF